MSLALSKASLEPLPDPRILLAGIISIPTLNSAPFTGVKFTNQSTICRIVIAVENANHARFDTVPMVPKNPKPPSPACRVNLLLPPASAHGPNAKNPMSAAKGPQMCAVSSRTKISGGKEPSTSRNRPLNPLYAIMLSIDPVNISVPNSEPGNILSPTSVIV